MLDIESKTLTSAGLSGLGDRNKFQGLSPQPEGQKIHEEDVCNTAFHPNNYAKTNLIVIF